MAGHCRPARPAPLAICVVLYGDVFLANLLTARPSHVLRAVYGLGRLQWILPALVLWAIWVAAEPKNRAAQFTMTHVGVSFVVYMLQWSGEAILDNAQFDLVIATAIGLGLAFDRAGKTAFGRRHGETAARAVLTLVVWPGYCHAAHRAGAGAVRSGYRAQYYANAEAARRDAARDREIQDRSPATSGGLRARRKRDSP